MPVGTRRALDEPTASLTATEVDRLFAVIDTLRTRGVAMMFVGHRLEEILRVSDRITVLRDGALVDTVATPQTTEEEVVRLMVGRSLGSLYDREPSPLGDVVLQTHGLSTTGTFSNIDITVRAGEVVGMAGLVGSGRTEVARALFGIERPRSGTIELGGRQTTVRGPAHAIELGIAYVSEDRRGQSVVEDFSILDNASLPMVSSATRWGVINKRAELALVAEPLERMRLKFRSYLQPVRTLSGGNQQKVVLAKWLATNPRLLILDEPTQGIDIQAKAEVHRIIAELSAHGIAILLISSDMPELLGACDRIYVMNHGEIAAELTGEAMNQYDVGIAATKVLPSRQVAATAVTTPSPGARDVLAPAPGVPRRSAASFLKVLLGRRELGLLVALAFIIVPLSLLNTNFYSRANLADLADYASLLGLVGIGQMLAAATMRAVPDAPIVLGIGVALATGLLCGLLNGLVVAFGQVPSIVVTLGTLALYRGALSIVSSGDRVKPEDVSDAWLSWTKDPVLGVSPVVLAVVVVAVLVGVAVYSTTRGRETYYVGSNPDGAQLIGIPVASRVLAAFVASGVLAGATGALWASYYPYVDGQVAFGLETAVIAAVVVGGVALRGGSGTVVGVLVGTVGLLAIRKVLTISGVPDQYLQAVYGAAIIVAVSVDAFLTNRAKRNELGA